MTVILGAGLSGLSAGYILSESGKDVVIVERDQEVGGLARTVSYHGFRFDLGGHRFITKDKRIENLVKDVLNNEFLTVERKSRIYMLNRYFDYPLKPSNAVFGIGLSNTLKILSDYSKEKIRNMLHQLETVSLEDWVVNRFGRKMFDLYFKHYSEKVWGIDCRSISQEWVTQRIKGLSLWEAIKNAFFNFSGRDIDTLADTFIYPVRGIGQISDNLRQLIEGQNEVLTQTGVVRIEHKDFSIRNVIARNGSSTFEIEGNDFVSTIPVTNLLKMLHPSPPDHVLEAAGHLHYRDLIIVTLMLDRERVADLTWLYFPEKRIPIGRIHEPKNWSPHMAPEGKTHIVAEYFCFQGNSIWNTDDETLAAITAEQLVNLGFFSRNEIIDSHVVRVPKAYPLLDTEYRGHYEEVLHYLGKFKNLHIAGRGGMFKYHNMDHAMLSGIVAAEEVLKKPALERTGERIPVGV